MAFEFSSKPGIVGGVIDDVYVKNFIKYREYSVPYSNGSLTQFDFYNGEFVDIEAFRKIV